MVFFDELLGWLNRLVVAESGADDSGDERITKAMLVVSVAVIATLATVWYGLLFALGRPWAAAIPLGYQLVSFTAIAVFAKTCDTRLASAFQPPLLARLLLLGHGRVG